MTRPLLNHPFVQSSVDWMYLQRASTAELERRSLATWPLRGKSVYQESPREQPRGYFLASSTPADKSRLLEGDAQDVYHLGHERVEPGLSPSR
jgi:hypothetical protein